MTPAEVRPTGDLCGQCSTPAVEVIVTVNGWVLDVCRACAVDACDPMRGLQ